MTLEKFKAWEQRTKKKLRRWIFKPVVTLPWEVKPGCYFPDPAPEMDGSQIAALREQEQMSQRELAHFLNVSIKTVQAWEQGLRRPEGPVHRLLQVLDETGKIFFFQLCRDP